MTQTASLAPADRLALIIEGLCQAVARRGGLGGLAGPLIILVWSRLRRLATRFAARAARHAMIPPVPFRPSRPRPARLRPSRPHPLPRRSAWLLRLVPETASVASQLRHFLADPETASLLAAAPQLRSILNPLCRMLGIRAAGIRPTQALRPPAAPSLPTPRRKQHPPHPHPSQSCPWQHRRRALHAAPNAPA